MTWIAKFSRRALYAARGVALAALIACTNCPAPAAFAATTHATTPPTTSSTAFAQPTPSINPKRITPIVRVYQKTHSAVVNISSTSIVQVHSGFGGMFNQLFQMPQFGPGREVEEKSVGSGFVIQKDGYIVTNAHVVARTAERKVIFADGKKYPAKIVAIDTHHDLALLKVNVGHPLPTIKLGTSRDLMVGETVVAIGNPFGFQNTLTAGVVSARHRTIHIRGHAVYKSLIQTDASINPGNSGGPLLNILGKLVGINTAIREHANNIGFAIPVQELREVLPGMLDVQRRYHFVMGMHVKAAAAPGLGALIDEVKAGGPAAKAGLKTGQMITAVDGGTVKSAIDYAIDLIGKKAGQRVTITLKDGSTHTVMLAVRPKPNGAQLLVQKFGIQARPLTRAEAQRMGAANLHGLVITEIQVASPADQAGFQPGDIIIQIGQHQPQTLDEVGQLLETVKTGQRVPIAILRVQGNVIYRLSTSVQAR